MRLPWARASAAKSKEVHFTDVQIVGEVTPAIEVYGESPAFFNFDKSGAHIHYIDQTGCLIKAPLKDCSLPSPMNDLADANPGQRHAKGSAGRTPFAQASGRYADGTPSSTPGGPLEPSFFPAGLPPCAPAHPQSLTANAPPLNFIPPCPSVVKSSTPAMAGVPYAPTSRHFLGAIPQVHGSATPRSQCVWQPRYC